MTEEKKNEQHLWGGSLDIGVEEDSKQVPQSESIKNLAAALSKMQGSIENAKKDTPGYNYKYADLGQILNLAKKPLADNNLTVTQSTMYDGPKLVIVTQVSHGESGEWIRGYFPIHKEWVAGQKMTNVMQALGSAVTYARRYAFAAMVGITQEDKDAAELSSK